MHMVKLELQGFKTFAQKTTLHFPSPKNGISPITAVVGPNGSGKSNISDGIRWVLGEQSLKLLRGKKSEDVIFSGSEGRSRSGFAEVAITFNNEDKAMPIDFTEVTITRRLYRDGQSEYLLNGSPARLSDIHLLLAQANVGQRSYSVVSQGMVDHILVSSPEERKEFFDDATGVKQFQIKRHSAMLKLKRTYENLTEVEMLLNEITPRLRSLKRQVSRLEQREEVEKELRTLEAGYYGTQWWNLQSQLDAVRGKFGVLDTDIRTQRSGLSDLEAKVQLIEKEESGPEEQDTGLMSLQAQYRETQKSRSKLRDEEFETQKKIELAKVRAQSNWAPLPLTKIIEELESITAELEEIDSLEDLENLKKRSSSLLKKSKHLVARLQRPQPEDIKPDPALVSRLKEIAAEKAVVEANLKDLDTQIENYAKKEKKVRTELIDLQRELRQKQQQIHLLENQRASVEIDVARLEERQQNLLREMNEQLKELAEDVRKKKPEENVDTEKVYPEIQRLRYKLELIGGIDPEIVAEYEEIKDRHEFLDGQVTDLHKAIKDTESIIDELDEQIRKQSEKAFKKIDTEFQKFFKVLFGGGSCSLVKMTKAEVEADDEFAGLTPDRVSDDTASAERIEHEEDTSSEAVKLRIQERQDRVVGIDIQATPPGKKLKSLNLLSGGERALTSIALLSAIMAVNPAPFVVLDEVDAALDEANTYRFANILEELSKLTQYIIVTHNRATMEKADILYGVTMGDDGVSNLLSVNMSDIEEHATARR